ncbi:S-adenosylmethionine-dependent methyltransferase Rv2258c-like [Ostrea edulis]|uniref:S-adenosylmethionine-dependent methyltransferase Rv2258c-like n=1 Tax=Ostrea edulis TaxID=37623 RepID=UPI0024AEDEB4|nr:S-adenosylmethionine-dependent methyltransferase Rv2258c-like [Ostrea edulis]XP_056015834.1 S-adenosylmethionine-dependent methyltransferase Rv2258c-like [Ostrea edulis]
MENSEKDEKNKQTTDGVDTVEKIIEDTVADGLHAMVLTLGYRVGIVDALYRLETPCTDREISDETGLNPRYVQEWLICMTTKGIIRYDNEKYSLPCSEQVQRAVLISAVLPMFADCLLKLEPAMRDKEHNTGYPFPQKDLEWLGKFNELNTFNSHWVESNLGTVFKSHFKDSQEQIKDILDFGCGYGKLSQQLAETYQYVNITGVDIDEQSIRHCQKTYKCPSLHFTSSKDISSTLNIRFDIIILMEVLHDLPDPGQILSELRTVLKPDGCIVTFDPNISSDISTNIGSKAAKIHLPFSVFFCLPNSMSKSPAVGHGAGWGVEDRRNFITEHGFTILNIDNNSVDPQYSRLVFKKSM